MTIPKYIYTIIVLLFISFTLTAQQTNDRIDLLKLHLETIEDEIPQLEKKVSFSISNVSLYEFLRGLATTNKLNINLDPSLNTPIVVNFSNVTIKDLILFLCEQYDLDLMFSGNIISVVQYELPPTPALLIIPKDPNISFNDSSNTLSYDLQNDTLRNVIKKIAELSGVNLIGSQKIQYTLINGYVKNMNLPQAIKEIAYANNFNIETEDSNTFYIDEKNAISVREINNNKNSTLSVDGLTLVTNKRDSILNIQAGNVPIKDILAAVASELNINFFLFSEIKGTADIKTTNITFDDFLKYLFNGTSYTFKLKNGVYLIGDRKLEEIRAVEVYQLKYRTINKIMEYIPGEMKKDIEILPLVDLNSVVIAGSSPGVNELKNFIRQIDKVVPVVNIELIILDIRKSHTVATGIMAGIDENNSKSSYSSVFPNIDINLNANAINSLITGINGTGLVNLGKVTPNFYVSLKASEDNGYLKIRSAPRLATLNGSEASMTIGETRYYAEQTTNVITTQSTTTVTGRTFKELQANFGINIKPIVSGDEQITLDISVEQSTFTEQFTKDGPYGRITRSFKSSLRVKNNDMILLGGLEEKSKDDSGQGIPVLSRIPILKWIFSSRSNTTKKSKLAILIHPVVFY